MIREKSLRREAIWRRITLHAFYASDYGHEVAGAAATHANREMMEVLEAMTAPEDQPALLQAVREVAKAAVEIWRRARLELDLVHSSMPSTANAGAIHGPDDVMLWVRPHIVSEHVDSNDRPTTTSCVYLQGTALRQGSPSVLTLRQEGLVGE
jgi:hypothetical protein